MNNLQMKLENPARIEELNPMETLKQIGLQDEHIVCDIGAGSGIFTIPAAQITNNKVYALDINEEMLSIIDAKAKAEGLQNIERLKVNNGFPLEDGVADIALLVTVLHEIDEPEDFLKEIKRVLKPNGKIAIIEFYKKITPMGPPVEHRMAKENILDVLTKTGFKVQKDFALGDNFYCMLVGQMGQ